MIATARVTAGPGGRITRLRSDPPITLRVTPKAVYLVGSAGGPLGGDEVRIEIDVEAGASLTIRSTAASVALPGLRGPNATDGLRGPNAPDGLRGPNAPDGLRGPNATDGLRGPNATDGLRGPNATDGLRGPNAIDGLRGPNAIDGPTPSTVTVEAHVGPGAELRWLVEPTVAARGCRHRIDAAVDLAVGARLLWVEEIVLGRHGEQSGSVTSRLSVDFDGAPLLRHELALGPDHPAGATSAVAGAARAIGTALVVGATATATVLGPAAAVLPLDGPGFQVVALAADRLTLRRLLDEGVSLGAHSVVPSETRQP